MFLDEVDIFVKGGDGGDGMVAFRREKYVPYGGPAGGDGGDGGDVILVADPGLSTLSWFEGRRHLKADKGKRGGNFNRTGADGEDNTIRVPTGTVVRERESGKLVADLTEPGQQIVVAAGGRGGRGNARFKSSTNQAPRMAEKGEPGEERWLTFELKLIADVGLVGVPNAGKSTLLSVVSAAKPKVAEYPFTTLSPNLGVVRIGGQDLIFADIPGLIEGAHEGVGLGHSFLRHVQRTRLLIHLLDGAGGDPVGDFLQINTELALFDPQLLDREQIVVLNKIDLPHAQKIASQVQEIVERHGFTFMKISAVTREGVQSLLQQTLHSYSQLPEPDAPEEVPFYTLEGDEDAFSIHRIDETTYEVRGERIERAAAMTYWEYDEAVMRFQRILGALGITDALRNIGVQEGDTVIFGDQALEWFE